MRRTFFIRRRKMQPKKILVCRTDRIGDFVLSLPVFDVLSNQLGMEVQVLCSPVVLPLVVNNPSVTVAHAYEPELEDHLISHLLSLNFDALLVLVNDPVARKLIPRLKTIPIRVGPISKPRALLWYNYPVLQKRSRSLYNEADYNLKLLGPFGYDEKIQPQPRFYFTAGEKSKFLRRFKQIAIDLDLSAGYVVLHAGMSGSALNWSFEAYQTLLKWLVAQGHQVVLTGSGPQEKGLVERLISLPFIKKSGQTVDLVDQLNLRELAILYTHTRLFIGPSTGPTHIAGASQAPVVSFYSPIRVQSATRWAPFQADAQVFTPKVDCPAIYHCRGESCEFYSCMDRISVDEVQQACLQKIRPVPRFLL